MACRTLTLASLLFSILFAWWPAVARAAGPDDDPNAVPPPASTPAPAAVGAQPFVPAPAPGAPPAAAPLADSEWSRRYVEARANMLAGRFAQAADQFRALATSAREMSQHIMASEQADICDRWARGGLVLVRASDLPASHAHLAAGLLADRRSADEIGILYTAAVLYGLGTGIVLDTWTNPSSAAGAILPVLALGAGASGLVYMLDNPQPMHYGVAQSITSGMWVGFEEGLAWSLWNQARAPFYDEWSGRAVATVLWASATGGAILGGTLGTAYGTTPGRASLVGSAALWTGLVSGLVAAAAAGNSPTADDNFMLVGALGLNAGAVAGTVLGKDVSPSIARVRFVDLGALAGGILGGGVYLAASNGHSDRTVMTLTLAAGIAGGVIAAWQLTAGMDPDYPRGAHQETQSPVSSLAPSILPTRSAGATGADGLVLGVTGGF